MFNQFQEYIECHNWLRINSINFVIFDLVKNAVKLDFVMPDFVVISCNISILVKCHESEKRLIISDIHMIYNYIMLCICYVV